MLGLRYKVVNQIKHMDALPKLLILESKANKSGSGFFPQSKVGDFFSPNHMVLEYRCIFVNVGRFTLSEFFGVQHPSIEYCQRAANRIPLI